MMADAEMSAADEANNDMQEDVREEAAPLVEEEFRGGAGGASGPVEVRRKLTLLQYWSQK